jgi:hypothetical protein
MSFQIAVNGKIVTKQSNNQYQVGSFIDLSKFITGTTSGGTGTVSAVNGLTKSGSSIGLGGNLSGDTTIKNYGHTLNIGSSLVDYFSTPAASTGTTNILHGQISPLSSISQFTVQNIAGQAAVQGTVQFSNLASVLSLSSGTTTIGVNNTIGVTQFFNRFTFTSGTTTFLNTKGNAIKYGADYSSKFTPRSIPDVGYVTGLTSSFSKAITGATNGLTVTGKRLKLGGTLTGRTDIDNSVTAGLGNFNIGAFTPMQGVFGQAYGSVSFYVATGTSSNYIRMQNGDPATWNGGILDLVGGNQSIIIGYDNFSFPAVRKGITFRTGGGTETSNPIQMFIDNSGIIHMSGTTLFSLAPKMTVDKSATYTPRSIPDVGYVTGKTSLNLLTTSFVTFSGTTGVLPRDYAKKVSFNTYTATTANGLYQSKSSVVTLTGTTLPATYSPLNLGIVILTGNTTISAAHNGKLIHANGTFTITLPNSLATGLNFSVTNIGTGAITFTAATTLNSISGNKRLVDQYGGVTMYHAGSNIWYAIGDLVA